MSENNAVGTVSLYCVGGTGGNIGTRFIKDHGVSNKGFAELRTYFIDTSRSNLAKNISDDQVFLYKDKNGADLDGNGKVRNSENYQYLAESANIGAILDKFKPSNLNIVLHSGGGGTGSVAGPLLAKELISRGENVVIIMIGSTISRLDIKNTLNTLKTYEKISDNLKNPTIVLYRENTKERTRAMIDKEIDQYIVLLTTFFSRQNHGLDTADLRNFLQYNRVTSHPPRMAALDLFWKSVTVPNDCFTITAATLTMENEEVDHGLLVEYQVSGVISPDMINDIKESMPLNMVTFFGFFPPIVTKLEGLLKQHEAHAKLISARPIVSNVDSANDDGLVL